MTIIRRKAQVHWIFASSKQYESSILEIMLMGSKLKQIRVKGPIIVGAGPSGLATAACLKDKGVPSIILEKDNCIASSWRLRAYNRLKLHLPKKFCELPLMPFPKEFPTYPTKKQFISYLDAYVQHFDIKPLFNMEVNNAVYDSRTGLWKVKASDLEFISKWLIVATGENAEVIWPEIEGIPEFHGQLLHTSCYRKGNDFQGQKVLVVGCGNSGMEVCLDLCENDAKVSMVVRDKLHVLPREILGISTFWLSLFLLRWLPISVVDAILLFCTRMILGDTEKYGLKRPEHGPLETKFTTGKTPVLDVGTLAKIKSGQIKVVPEIARFTARGVEFFDGRQEEFDSVILATGYRSNVTSWIKDGGFFSEKNGFPSTPFPNSWRGKNGLYATGFTRRGLLGVAVDAQRVAEDIEKQWNDMN